MEVQMDTNMQKSRNISHRQESQKPSYFQTLEIDRQKLIKEDADRANNILKGIIEKHNAQK